jgi:chorismate synthase
MVLDGIPSGVLIDWEQVKVQMERRSAVGKPYATDRKEEDSFEILSGWSQTGTDGGALAALIPNGDIRSKDYEEMLFIPRPMHADYPAMVKYGTGYNPRGGSFFSGRMTAPLVLAGSIVRQLLEKKGIYIGAHIASIAEVRDKNFPALALPQTLLRDLATQSFPVIHQEAGLKMMEEINRAKENGDSVGGTVECGIINLPVGVGSPWFMGLESQLSAILFAIPGVKGLEFGSGFEGTKMLGSQHNDAYYLKDGMIRTKSNHHGGILGGLSTGMPLLFRVAFKPTASIAKEQDSINMHKGEECKVSVTGRHDPCIVPRALICVESAVAIALADELMIEGLL